MSAAESDPQRRPPFWDRGLFWFGLFGTMAVLGVLVIAPKYQDRRSKMDLNFKGREISYEVRLKQREEYLAAHPDARRISLPARFEVALWVLVIPATALAVSLAAHFYLRSTGRADRSDEPLREPPRRK